MERLVWISLLLLGLTERSKQSVSVGVGSDDPLPDTEDSEESQDPEGYDSLLEKWGKPFRDNSLVLTQDAHGISRFQLYPASWMKEKLCPEKLWSNLRLVSNVYLMTAGSFQIGTEKPKVEFIHLLPESDYIHVPTKAFELIVKAVPQHTGKNIHTKRQGIYLKRSEINALPSIKIQFANTEVVYELTPLAYTRCADDGSDSCEVMIKLAILDKSYWYLGKPFFDHVVTAISIGNVKKAFVHVCPPKQAAAEPRVKFYSTETKVGMPWTPSDYTLMAMIAAFVVGGIIYMFRRKLYCCARRARRNQVPSEDDTAPLLNNN